MNIYDNITSPFKLKINVRVYRRTEYWSTEENITYITIDIYRVINSGTKWISVKAYDKKKRYWWVPKQWLQIWEKLITKSDLSFPI